MTALMAKMAQRAAENQTLMASILDNYAEKKGLQWKDLAAQLRIDDQEIEKLALCRRPRIQNFAEDIDQITGYVRVDRFLLTEFVQEAERIAPRIPEKKVKAEPARVSVPRKRSNWVYAFAAVAALVILLLASAVVFAQPGDTAATLVVTGGEATVDQTVRFLGIFPTQNQKTALPGNSVTVSQNDTIQVGPGASVALNLQDGSVIEISENSTLQVSELVVTEDSVRVRLRLIAGRAFSRVRKLLGVDDVFEIITPSSTVSVRGTEFVVKVLSPDTTYLAVMEGLVTMQMGEQMVEVAAGEQVIGETGETMAVEPYTGVEPDYLDAAPGDSTPVIENTPEATATPAPTGSITAPASTSGSEEGTGESGSSTGGTVPTEEPVSTEAPAPTQEPAPTQDPKWTPPGHGGVPPGQEKKTPTP